MSKLVKSGITYFFLALVQKIFRGRILLTVMGAVVGGSIGIFGRYLDSALMPPCIFLGMILGAAIAASFFPKPEPVPTPEEPKSD